MRINNNIMALNTHRQLGINTNASAKSIEKLSSGYRINRAGDDAAGLAISEKMRGQIRGLDQASRNAQDGISLIQTAEGALSETHSILQRMRELAVQAANDTNVTVDREQIQKEINQLTTEINRIGSTTEFNTMKLLDGSKETTLKSTATGVSVVSAGTVTVADPATGFTVAGDSNLKAAIGSISSDATGEFGTNASTAGATITVTKTSTGYTVQLLAANTAGGTYSQFSATDTIVADANGDFTYNNHGVNFTITAEDDATVTNGSTLTITDQDTATGTATSYSLSSVWNVSADGTGNLAMGSIDFAQTDDNADVRYVKIFGTSAGVTVQLLDGGTATAAVTQEDVYAYTAVGTIAYNEHGVSFSLDISAYTGAVTFSATISLTAQLALTTTYSDADYDKGALKFQVGANQNQSMSLEISDMRATALEISMTAGGTQTLTVGTAQVTAYFVSTANVTDGTDDALSQYALDVSSYDKAAAAITVINGAIEDVSSERAKLGAVQNRLEHTIANLDTSSENLTASESRIRDVDMAKEMMTYTKNNILQQAAQAMLAQANQAPQGVLQLLR